MSVSPALTFSGAEKLAVNSGFTSPDGTKYSYTRGESGKIHGLFIMETVEGISRSLWQNGEPNGKTECIYADRKVTYMRKGDQQIGSMLVEFNDGTRMTIPCDERGKYTGEGSVVYPEGTLQTVTFKNSKPQKSVLSRNGDTITYSYSDMGRALRDGVMKKATEKKGSLLPDPDLYQANIEYYYRWKLAPELPAPKPR